MFRRTRRSESAPGGGGLPGDGQGCGQVDSGQPSGESASPRILFVDDLVCPARVPSAKRALAFSFSPSSYHRSATSPISYTPIGRAFDSPGMKGGAIEQGELSIALSGRQGIGHRQQDPGSHNWLPNQFDHRDRLLGVARCERLGQGKEHLRLDCLVRKLNCIEFPKDPSRVHRRKRR